MKEFIDAVYMRKFQYINDALEGDCNLVNYIDEYGNTPLMIAVAQGYYTLCGLLLQYGADPNFKNNGNDIMGIACHYGNRDIIDLLVECGGIKTQEHEYIYNRNNPQKELNDEYSI